MSVKPFKGVIQSAALPAVDTTNLLANVAEGEVAEQASFELDDGARFIIPRDKYFRLNSAIVEERRNRPVYLEAKEETAEVVRLLVPRVRRVAEAIEVQGALSVRLDASPTRFFLFPNRPQAMWDLVKTAAKDHSELLITDDPATHEILDVQVPSVQAPPVPAPAALAQEPEPEPTVLALNEANEVFRFLADQRQIPFDYVDDCCTSRAHEMFRLLRNEQIHCRKIWNYGGGGDPRHGALRFFTPSHPEGLVRWFFHVAPVVKVALPRMVVDMVLDPAVFDRPMRVPDWVALQHDGLSVQEVTRPEIFLQWLGGVESRRDDDFEDTRRFTEVHRLERVRRILDLTP